MTREEAISKAINIVRYFEAHFAKSKEAREDAVNIIEALEQEPCEDCIRREDALMALTGEWTESRDEILSKAIKRIKGLPPITSQQKIGRWIDGKCNKCGTHAPFWAMASTYYCSDYCPKCGAKMQEVNK
jgi:hypothetical protein